MDPEKRRQLGRALRIIGLVVVLVLVAPFVVYAVPQTIGADHSYIVLSGSMEPTLSPGDAVIVREVPAGEIEERDIITYQQERSDTPTTHRVVAIEQTDGQRGFVTRGDANENRDPGTVTPSQVVGKVVFVIPLMGHAVQLINSPLGLIALIGIPLGLLVVSEVWRFARTPNSSETEMDTTTPTGTSSQTDTSTTADGGFRITPSSLQLIIALFGFYVIYSWYIAATRLEGLTIGVATATTIALLYGIALYYRHYGGSSTSTVVSDGGSTPAESTGESAGVDPDDSEHN